MIASLRGSLLDVSEQTLILGVQGVGYELICSNATIDYAEQSDVLHLYVYTHVREDLIQLFGFQTKSEKNFFMSLIKVNGVGPKMAVSILSAAPFQQLTRMIDDGDVKSLMKLPKIGKKKAEQIILSLKGKLVLDEAHKGVSSSLRREVVSGLVNLGFKLTDVEFIVEKLKEPQSVQEGIRSALAALSSQ